MFSFEDDLKLGQQQIYIQRMLRMMKDEVQQKKMKICIRNNEMATSNKKGIKKGC